MRPPGCDLVPKQHHSPPEAHEQQTIDFQIKNWNPLAVCHAMLRTAFQIIF